MKSRLQFKEVFMKRKILVVVLVVGGIAFIVNAVKLLSDCYFV